MAENYKITILKAFRQWLTYQRRRSTASLPNCLAAFNNLVLIVYINQRKKILISLRQRNWLYIKLFLIEFSTICCSLFLCFKDKTSAFTWVEQTMNLKAVFSFAQFFVILRLENLFNRDTDMSERHLHNVRHVLYSMCLKF